MKQILAILLASYSVSLFSQEIYEMRNRDAQLFFFNKEQAQHVPHMMRMFAHGKALHSQIWDVKNPFRHQRPIMLLTDFEDSGNAGVATIPYNIIMIGTAPMNFSYFISPSTERYHHLFRHEYTHVVMSDKATKSDMRWRKLMGGKFSTSPEHPFSALWSYLGSPRWYAPRWYHEGIACFLETWTAGGTGRALGGYDEMYFRNLVREDSKMSTVVGLATEGSTTDFQLGANAYLYGTRFVNYLQYKYGFDKVREFYNRTEDSKRLFNSQFRKVFGESLTDVWDNWLCEEREHQHEQLKALSEYPVTAVSPIVAECMGSVSSPVIDKENDAMYLAVNYPGSLPHIERIDLKTQERESLCHLDDAMLYQTTYLTLDKRRQRLIYVTNCNGMRGFNVYDLQRRKIVKKKKLQRVSDIVYDNVNDCMYGIFVNAGNSYLIRYDSDLEKSDILYTFAYGESVFDIDVSHDGNWISATKSGANGEQTLIRFNAKRLENADFSFETLYSMEDGNLGQFRFTPGDSVMVGSSYYTGVSNIWQLNLKSKELQLLSNTLSGLFSPVLQNDSSIIALECLRDGMRPVRMNREVIHDANAVEYFGQKAHDRNPEPLDSMHTVWNPKEEITFSSIYDSISVYKPLGRLCFTGAYPEVSGFRDTESWNEVTPVLGYHLAFQDPLGIHSLDLSLGISPWSHNRAENQYHAEANWKYRTWRATASWNPTSFYDLFGPTQRSRKGWQATIGYDWSMTAIGPVSTSWGFELGAYGRMDALPLYQDVSAEISHFQTLSAYFSQSKKNASLGATMVESGWGYSLSGYAYYAGKEFMPTLNLSGEKGWLMPFLRNTCLWLREDVGQSFGSGLSVFGNTYFGGFGNNWVDYGRTNRYRDRTSMAGAEINALSAHSFSKTSAELSLQPIRFRNAGFLNLYPTYTQCHIFCSHLFSNPWGRGEKGNYTNLGIQLNTEVALFTYLKTTWSIGYAHIWDNRTGSNRGAWLLSLKLL